MNESHRTDVFKLNVSLVKANLEMSVSRNVVVLDQCLRPIVYLENSFPISQEPCPLLLFSIDQWFSALASQEPYRPLVFSIDQWFSVFLHPVTTFTTTYLYKFTPPFYIAMIITDIAKYHSTNTATDNIVRTAGWEPLL